MNRKQFDKLPLYVRQEIRNLRATIARLEKEREIFSTNNEKGNIRVSQKSALGDTGHTYDSSDVRITFGFGERSLIVEEPMEWKNCICVHCNFDTLSIIPVSSNWVKIGVNRNHEIEQKLMGAKRYGEKE